MVTHLYMYYILLLLFYSPAYFLKLTIKWYVVLYQLEVPISPTSCVCMQEAMWHSQTTKPPHNAFLGMPLHHEATHACVRTHVQMHTFAYMLTCVHTHTFRKADSFSAYHAFKTSTELFWTLQWVLRDFTLLLFAHSKRTYLIVTRMLHHTQRWVMNSYLDSPGECGPGPAIFQLFTLTGILTCQSSWRLFSVGVAIFWEFQFVLHMSKVQFGTLTHSIKQIGTISIPTPCHFFTCDTEHKNPFPLSNWSWALVAPAPLSITSCPLPLPTHPLTSISALPNLSNFHSILFWNVLSSIVV